MEFIFKIFPYVFGGIFIIAILGILFNIIVMFSPKLRAKIMKQHVKSMKYFVEDSKDELSGLASATSDTMEKSKDSLKKMADMTAEINEDAIEKTAEAITKGIKKGSK